MTLQTNALVSLADVKAWLDIPLTEISFDLKAELLINAASDRIESYLDRSLERKVRSERIDGVRSSRIPLRHYPADSVSILSFSSDWDFTDNIPTSGFEMQEQSIIVLKNAASPRGNLNVKVMYAAGYVLPNSQLVTGEPLPSDLKLACLLLVQWLWQVERDRRLGVSSKSKQSESISFEQGMPREIAEMLLPHKRLEFTAIHGSTDNF